MSESTEKINQKVNEITQKYVGRKPEKSMKAKRAVHSGVFTKDERKSEIESSGLFEILKIFEYRTEIRNNAEQFIQSQKSVPAFASFLDEMDEQAIQDMEDEISSVINKNGGYVGTIFDYSLYITKKIASGKLL